MMRVSPGAPAVRLALAQLLERRPETPKATFADR